MYQGIGEIYAHEASEASLRRLEGATVERRIYDLAHEKEEPQVLVDLIGTLLEHYFVGNYSGLGIAEVDEIYMRLTGTTPNWNMLPHDQNLQRVNQDVNEMFIWHDFLTREDNIGHTSIGSLAPTIFRVTDNLTQHGIALPAGRLAMGGANQIISMAEFAAIAEMLGFQGECAAIDFVTGHNGQLARELGVDFVKSNIIRPDGFVPGSLSMWIHDNLLTTLMNPEPYEIMSGYEHTGAISSMIEWLAPGGILIARETSKLNWPDMMDAYGLSVIEVPWLSFANRRQQTRYFCGYGDTEHVEYDQMVIVARKADGSEQDEYWHEGLV